MPDVTFASYDEVIVPRSTDWRGYPAAATNMICLAGAEERRNNGSIDYFQFDAEPSSIVALSIGATI